MPLRGLLQGRTPIQSIIFCQTAKCFGDDLIRWGLAKGGGALWGRPYHQDKLAALRRQLVQPDHNWAYSQLFVSLGELPTNC